MAPTRYSVINHYTAIDSGTPFKPHWQCSHCDHRLVSPSTRRKLEHTLGVGTSIRGYPNAAGKLSAEEHLSLKEELAHMNTSLASARRKKEGKRKTVDSLVVPVRARSKQDSLNFAIQNKDRLDMEFARMLVMTAVKSGFMGSEYVSAFFSTRFHYQPPLRKVIMGPLLELLYEDTKKKVIEACNFKDLDSPCTFTMDAWKSPTNAHIRNYMVVFGHATFFWTATYGGPTRSTAANIAAEAIDAIEDTGDANIAAVATDNASETTSWYQIRQSYSDILCKGCTTHGASLLFKSACDHTWSKRIIKKATKLAKFVKNHSYTCAELKRRTAVANGTSLPIIIHGETRFTGVYYTLRRLGELRGVIREIVVLDGFAKFNFDNSDTITSICSDSGFWTNMDKLRLYLKPLKCLMKLFDRDTHTTEHVFPGMLEVKGKWEPMRWTCIPPSRTTAFVSIGPDVNGCSSTFT